MNEDMMKAVYGTYMPDKTTIFYRLLTKVGISRGIVRKWVAKQWAKRKYILVDTCIRGVKYRLNIKENPTDEKILTSSKFYDQDEIAALASMLMVEDSQSVFIDIGANTGYYSLNLAYRGYSRVLAIEPNPTTIELLSFNVNVNEFGKSIEIIPLCIGSGKEMPFYCSGNLGSASVFHQPHNVKPIMVGSASLSSILEKNGVTKITGMKIDIEGFEDRALFPFFETVLESMWPGVIVIEDCNKELWERDIISKMVNIGYKVVGKTRGNQILKRIMD
ncbi:MAG: FkbM family methyltransferase [Desulfuromonadales bacterium]|nr:FkbM family methyltransferase [Desulfuromonadales bacterium]